MKTLYSSFNIDMTSDTKAYGSEGENCAAEYMEDLGYRIVERNYKCKIGELDLIAAKGKLLVFAEVKSRRSLSYGSPVEAVHRKKMRQIRRVASWYLTENMRISRLYSDFEFRFDVIEIVTTCAGNEVNHIERAF